MAKFKKAAPVWKIEAADVAQYGVTDLECGDVIVRLRTPRATVKSIEGIEHVTPIEDRRLRLANRSSLLIIGSQTTHVPLDALRVAVRALGPKAMGSMSGPDGKLAQVVIADKLDEFHAAQVAARKEFGGGVDGGRYVADDGSDAE